MYPGVQCAMEGLTCDLHQRINISATILKSSLESASGSFSHLDLQVKTLTHQLHLLPTLKWNRLFISELCTLACCCPRSGSAWDKRHKGPCRGRRTHPGWAARPPGCPLDRQPSAALPQTPPSLSSSSASPASAGNGSWANLHELCWWWAAHKLRSGNKGVHLILWQQFSAVHFLSYIVAHLRSSSSKRLHRCPGCCWGSWGCSRGWRWGAPRWLWCSKCCPHWPAGSPAPSPTSRRGSYTAWAAPLRWRGASPCSGPQTPPCRWCPSSGRPDVASRDTSPQLSPVCRGLKVNIEKQQKKAVWFDLNSWPLVINTSLLKYRSTWLTGSFSGALGIKDGAGVIGVEQRLQEGYRHGSSQRGQTLTQSWQLSAEPREEERR